MNIYIVVVHSDDDVINIKPFATLNAAFMGAAELIPNRVLVWKDEANDRSHLPDATKVWAVDTDTETAVETGIDEILIAEFII